MDAFKLHEILHSKVQPGPELNNPVKPNVDTDFKTPHIPKGAIDMKPVNMNSDQNLISKTTKNGAKPFPWKGVCVFGLVLLGTYLFLQIPPDENYKRRRR